MKEKRSLFIRFVIGVSCVICILLYACANEEFVSNDLPTNGVTFGKNDVLTIDAAKNWFSENSLPVCEMRASDNSQGFLLRPSWNHAKEWKNGKYEVVETSLITQTSIIFYDDETSKNVKWEKDFKKIQNVGRMVFLKNLETGETRNFIMIIIGSYEYLMKKDNKLSKNNYLYREPKFDGTILYYKPDGGFTNGWKYKNGKITHKISPCDNSSLPVLTRSTECHYEYYTYTYDVCSETNSAEFGGITGNNTTGYSIPEVTVQGCTWKNGIATYYVCEYVDNGGSGSGIGGGGGDSPPPGGEGSTENPPQNVTYSATITGAYRVDLLDNFYFTPTITPSASIVNVKYEIGKNALAFEKWTLQEGIQPVCSALALTPGEWFVRATITLSDTVIISNTLSVDVIYPDVYDIKDNPTVISQMESVWQQTKDAASALGRSERGFWIYLNTSNSTYEFGEIFGGDTVQCGTQAKLEFNSAIDSPSNSPIVGGKYAVCFFHAHTPLTFCEGYLKGVGPSDGDASSIPNFPGLVYDYIGTYENGTNLLVGGHNINDAANIYTYGSYRRSN